MGAYTFEAHPPFRMTSISPYPILFQGIYQAPLHRLASRYLYCIYPAGLVLAKEGEREVLHLSCGENDSAIKIITFDKQKLLSSLVRLRRSSKEL